MPRAITMVKSDTKVSAKVAVGVGIVAVAAIIATFGPRLVGNFAAAPMSAGLANTNAIATSTATTTTAFNCTDTDGGKNFDIKGTATVGNFSLTDSCKNATTLNEAWCDPARQYVNSIEQTCELGCSNSACNRSAAVIWPAAKPTLTTFSTSSGMSTAQVNFKIYIAPTSSDVYIQLKNGTSTDSFALQGYAVVKEGTWNVVATSSSIQNVLYTIPSGVVSLGNNLYKVSQNTHATIPLALTIINKGFNNQPLLPGTYHAELRGLVYRTSATGTFLTQFEPSTLWQTNSITVASTTPLQ